MGFIDFTSLNIIYILQPLKSLVRVQKCSCKSPWNRAACNMEKAEKSRQKYEGKHFICALYKIRMQIFPFWN